MWIGNFERGTRELEIEQCNNMTSSDIFVASIFLALCAMAWLAIFGRGS
jgi:hypothetical protein